ncbi:hypothetical protein MASR2M18_04480 [Ignavibacteria bacterium]
MQAYSSSEKDRTLNVLHGGIGAAFSEINSFRTASKIKPFLVGFVKKGSKHSRLPVYVCTWVKRTPPGYTIQQNVIVIVQGMPFVSKELMLVVVGPFHPAGHCA